MQRRLSSDFHPNLLPMGEGLTGAMVSGDEYAGWSVELPPSQSSSVEGDKGIRQEEDKDGGKGDLRNNGHRGGPG